MARHSKAANRTHKKRSSPGDQQQQQLPAASPLFSTATRRRASAARLHVERGSAAEAVAAYVRVLELDPGLRSPEVADAHVQLAAYSLGAGSRGGLYAAVGHLRRATEIAPTLAAAHLLLADGYRDLGLPEHAIESLRSVVKYRPRDAAGLSGLGAAHLELGHFKQSVNAYRKAHALAPAATDVKYALAALLGEPVVPQRAPPSSGAPTSEPGLPEGGRRAGRRRRAGTSRAAPDAAAPRRRGGGGDDPPPPANLNAKAPLPPLNGTVQDEPHLFAQVHGLLFDDQLLDVVLETLRSALVVDGDADGGGRWLDVLELGCGDGVAGQHLRTLANRLHCVDLSAGALAVAEARRAYDVLERGEFVSTARALLPDSQDLVVAVDAVPYLGDLADFFGAVASVLRPGGLAIFNTGHRVKYVTGLARPTASSVKPTMLLKVETRLVWNAREQKAGWVERGSKEARDAAIRTGVFAFRKED
ncbi:hypothetical protein JL720_15050 [Aureococcus anophagefferens]|nr:hypothetical protein JL720_15050 [Aureococcus anophagefferens]